MYFTRNFLLVSLLACSPLCWAQSWSVSGEGGFGFYRDATIDNSTGSAKAGFGPRIALSGALSQDFLEHFGGELRYAFLDGDTELKSGGVESNLDAASHVVHYDFLAYATGRQARLRPFVALGGGIKYYTATGNEQPFQPLTDFAFLDHANQVEGLISVGGGVRYSLTQHWGLKFDFRDYLTPFPNKIITPAPGANQHGWLNDFVFMAGVEWKFGPK